MPTQDDLGTVYDRALRFLPDRIEPAYVNPPRGYKPFGELDPNAVVYRPPAPGSKPSDIGSLFAPVPFKHPLDLGKAFGPGTKRTNLPDEDILPDVTTIKPDDLGLLFVAPVVTHPSDIGDILPDGDPRTNLGSSNVYK